MKARLQIDSNFSRVKAISELRSLKIREGQTVSEFCLVLERIANRAYPDVPTDTVSLQKAEILCRQLAKWERSYCLTEAIETSEHTLAYEKVKEAALRLERSRAAAHCVAQDCTTSPLKGPAKPRNLEYSFRRKAEYRQTKPKYKHNASRNNQNNEHSDKTERVLQENEKTTLCKEHKEASRRCYNCGRLGHNAKECRYPPHQKSEQSQVQRTFAPANKEQRSGSYTTLLENWSCSIQPTIHKPSPLLFGDKSLINIEMMGMKTVALLNTGSEASIMPAKLLKTSANNGINLYAYVERIEKPTVNIRDASGNQMLFFDAIQLGVFLEDRVEFIPFLIGKGLDEVVILGTNALQLLGIRLVKENLKNEAEKAEEPATPKACNKVASKNRVFVPPEAMKTITLATTSTLCEPVFWSSHPFCLTVYAGCPPKEVDIPVLNDTEETIVFRKGEVVGECSENDWRKSTQIGDCTGIPIEQLNDLNNEGVSFAKVHTWKKITVKLMTRKALLLLPSGFRSHNAVFESNGDYDICIYEKIPDMVKTLVDHDPRAAVVVTPTTNTPIPKQEWMRLSTSIAKVALRGTKVVVAGPRGEKAWEQNRIDAREMIEWAKNGAMTMSRNVIDKIVMLESVSEPCHSVGKHCRPTQKIRILTWS
ncbi:hypothetical protein Y032_0002g562 [Ancylostoma ceylanicum]|uniref:CCHC-type domain-containing protein n=1 Tax=Ancylostoma ceylanicum TaxID=53326 RepID=A0A016VZM8_9BILA|nr:hypothetical protein Y032_0002g562 [Ancylostoma ceylanicum]